jgi:HD-GYP domain-containing protein (c-di-GMP phosphodiesterase class II)
MKTHPEVGEWILRPIRSLGAILPIVRHHHERWDGGGYPDGLAERAIPLGARIVSVCDAYRAMTEDRPYRQALPEQWARRELVSGNGTQFDPDCVAALFRVLDRREATATVVALRPPSAT